MKDEEEAKEAAVNAQCNQKAVAKEPRPFGLPVMSIGFFVGLSYPSTPCSNAFSAEDSAACASHSLHGVARENCRP